MEYIYHDLRSAGIIIPAGEGRSKGSLSIPISEMAKMKHGKIVIDRGDIGFPGKDLEEAAPILKKRYGQVCLLINSGSKTKKNRTKRMWLKLKFSPLLHYYSDNS